MEHKIQSAKYNDEQRLSLWEGTRGRYEFFDTEPVKVDRLMSCRHPFLMVYDEVGEIDSETFTVLDKVCRSYRRESDDRERIIRVFGGFNRWYYHNMG